MVDADLTAGTALKKQITAIEDAQTAIALTGSALAPSVVVGGSTTVSNSDLKTALGSAYDSYVASAKSTLSTALASALTTADNAYAAL